MVEKGKEPQLKGERHLPRQMSLGGTEIRCERCGQSLLGQSRDATCYGDGDDTKRDVNTLFAQY